MSTRSAPARPFPLGFATRALLCAAAVTAGCGYLLGLAEMEPVALVVGMAAVGALAVHCLRAQRDWLNPVFLLAATALLRIAVPAVLVAGWGVPVHFHIFGLHAREWHQGRMLALMGLSAICLGWLLLPGTTALLGRTAAASLHRRFRVDPRTVAIAGTCVLAGVAAMVLFFRANFASSAEALESGVIRRSQRVAGTSHYAMLGALMLTYGSLLSSAYLLLVRRARWLPALLPVLGVMVVLSGFGGRVQAITPLAFACICLWYRADRSRLGYGRVLAALLAVVALFAAYSVFLSFYRTGLGIEAARYAFTSAGLSRYRSATLWYEAGALHNYALAAHFAPGVLHGGSVPLVTGLWGTIFGLDGVRPGRFLVTATIGAIGKRAWEFHSGVIVDLYLNFGVTAVVVGCVLFGMLLHTCYRGMLAYRHSPVVLAFYSVLLWRLFWMFYEHTIGALDIVLVIFPVMMLMLLAGRVLPARLRPAGFAALPAPAPAAG